jgi:hypothetical protein
VGGCDGEAPLFVGDTLLTALNGNAVVTYFATPAANHDQLKISVVEGAVSWQTSPAWSATVD